MHIRLQTILSEHQWNHKRIIVAISGGLDSMVLATLLKNAGMDIVLAHCNFGLRGRESDGDEELVSNWAKANDIPCFIKKFETKKILEKQGGNLQETARDLRYSWFEQLRKELNFDLIATAHHKQDSVETMLINFFKGTGIAGMHGILPQQYHIIRPLLSFNKEELKQYALEQQIQWREDSSNQKEDYTRNAIRHQLFPVVDKIFPNVLDNLAGNTQRFAATEILYRESIERYRKKLITERNKDWYIPVLKLRLVIPLSTILWELIKPFNFNPAQLKDALHLMDAATGKYIASPTHRIIRNRDFLIITTLEHKQSTHILISNEEKEISAPEFIISITRDDFREKDMGKIKSLGKEEICLDVKELQFPLVLRPWKIGDYFYPMGMNRKKKKVSRFLIEQKLAQQEKEKVWVLESGKKIAWVIGMRPDERFKIQMHTVKCIWFSVNKR